MRQLLAGIPFVVWAFVLVFLGGSSVASESAFRYQGRLSEAGSGVNGMFDLKFALFEAVAEGSALAGPLTNSSVAVSNGLFVATIDFGLDVFTGGSRWLEISVRRAGGAEFVTLAPRQPLSPVPYALHTLKAESLSAPLSSALLPTNLARLDLDQTFGGQVSFRTNVSVQGTIRAGAFSGDGSSLSNVAADGLSARLAQRLWRVPIPLVTVTNAGNPPDVTGKGAVPYNYRIGKFEINNHQYAVFLNAVAADDPNELYDTNMTYDVHGGIVRSGQPGEYLYSVKPGMEHLPVVWVEFPDTLRFCNWLHNGQPAGAQEASTTEDGAYTMNPVTVWGNTIRHNAGARFWIPTDDEWYKAAYFQPESAGGKPGGYWIFPTRSDDPPFSEEPPGFSNSANVCCGTDRRATDVGAYVEAPSFYGTFDQAGNVEEWTEEIVYVTNRRLRGGSWTYNEFYSKSTDFEFDTPDYEADGIGFRVAGLALP